MYNLMKLWSICLILVLTSVSVAQADSEALHLKKVSCHDQQMGSVEAFSMLIPHEWHFSCNVAWNLQNITPNYTFKIESSDGSYIMERMSFKQFYWSLNPWMQQITPVGSNYMGMFVYPPMTAKEYLNQSFVPEYRTQMSNFQIKEFKSLPKEKEKIYTGLLNNIGSTAQLDADAVEAIVTYSENGIKREERIIVGLYYIQLYGGIVNWGVSFNGAITTPLGKLHNIDTIRAVVDNSFTENRVWRNKANYLNQLYVQQQIRNIQHIGELSRKFSQISNEIADEQWQGNKRRSASSDKMADAHSRSLRGVEEYYNPIDNQSVELPTGYERIWTNGTDYLLSNDPNYNPSTYNNQSWTPMKQTAD